MYVHVRISGDRKFVSIAGFKEMGLYGSLDAVVGGT